MRVYQSKKNSRFQLHQKNLSLSTIHKNFKSVHHPLKKRLPSNYLRLQERIARSQFCYNANKKNDSNGLLYTKYPLDERSRFKKALRKPRFTSTMNQSLFQQYNRGNNFIIDNSNLSNFSMKNNCKNDMQNLSDISSIQYNSRDRFQDEVGHADFGFGSSVSQIVSNPEYSSPSSCSDPSLSSPSSLSPSPITTPTSTHDLKHNELTMLKHEAFQELACQTKRFDDLFIAKMIYWEGLSTEEKAQWLERNHDESSAGFSGSDDEEMNDLISALDCRATCKDYSALVAFERQAEIERRQRILAGNQYQSSDEIACWDPESL